MPKLKKAPKNSYYFFITKRLERAKAEGYVIWGGFQEASRTFGFEWGLLSKEERAPYEQMAKEAKEQDKYDVNNKFTTTGETYATVFQQQLERNTAQQQMESFIERMTLGPEAGNRVYIFMKCVHSVEMLKDKRSQTYMPAELSMAAFTLKGGMERIYTTLIDTQEVPMGYASSARENAEDSLLPLPGDNSYTEETRDYGEILKKIFGFANHFQKAEGGYDMPGHYRVFFCREAEIAPISTGLQWLVDQLTDFQREKYQYLLDTVKVYSFNKLIIGMAQEAHKVNTSYSNAVVLNKVLAESIILKGNYEYRPEIACLFHSSKRGSMKMQNCAQSIVMRRIFMLFDEFVPAYKYKWTERHDISNVGKGFQHTMIKEKREEKPVEEVVINEIPDWLRDEPKEKPKVSLDELQPSPSVSHKNGDIAKLEIESLKGVKRKIDSESDQDICLKIPKDCQSPPCKRANLHAFTVDDDEPPYPNTNQKPQAYRRSVRSMLPVRHLHLSKKHVLPLGWILSQNQGLQESLMKLRVLMMMKTMAYQLGQKHLLLRQHL